MLERVTDSKISVTKTFKLNSFNSELSVHETRSELDSHADTCVVGKEALIVHDFDRTVNVSGFDESLGTVKGLKTVSAAVAYDDPITGRPVILVIHQAILVPSLEHNLLCPMQMRLNDVEVSEIPKFLTDKPSNEVHCIQATDDSGENITIPLSLHGVTSYFPTRKPSTREYEDPDIKHYDLTYEAPEWEPGDESYAEQEDAMTDFHGLVHEIGDRDDRGHQIFNVSKIKISQSQAKRVSDFIGMTAIMSLSSSLDDAAFLDALQSNVNVSNVTSSTRKPKIDPAKLARTWGIGIEAASRTVRVTTQRGIRTVMHPSLSRRFRTNDRQLRYRRLRTDLYSDTLESSTTSKRGNKYAQVFGTNFGWARAFPMPKKSDAHEGLSLLFSRDGVPSTMIVDGSKEQTMGQFKKKAREAGCHIRTTEPYSQWSNAAEGAIRELKRGTGRKLIKSKAPKKLWDDCLELEALIRSNTAHEIYELGGEVPETVVSGETSDISPFCELEWYEWVMFRDSAVSFPEEKMVLGRYLGPSADVGPAMTAKLLKSNGWTVHKSTYRALTPEELASPTHQKMREIFDKCIEEKLGPSAEPGDFSEDPDISTPTFEPYGDDDDGDGVATPDAEDVSGETADEYVGAEVTLPRGDQQVAGKVVRRKRDVNGSLKGTANSNPILDTRTYCVEFPDGSEAEYAANVIAENMWAQCDIDGNQHVLMESIIDYKTDGHAVKVADAYFSYNGKRHMRKTTKGWELCVQWKNSSTSWQRLADLKESNPVEVAEYAVAQGIDHEPAFAWWVPYTLRRRDRIIAAVNKRFQKKTHKFGILVPNSVEEALAVDKANGNTLW